MLTDAAIRDLADGMRGTVVTAGSAAFDQARRVFNAMIDRRPAVIAQCAATDDVVRALAFALEHGLAISVRGGGHGVAGTAVCDAGLMIDLSPMKAVRVDARERVAVAEPGVTLGELDMETQRHGLATPLGIVSDTGIAGLTLGGGLGWLNGRFGLACDNLEWAEIVTADGGRRRLSAADEPDLFWAVRGGGGNFGIVTALAYRLHPVDEVVGGLAIFPIERGRDVLAAFDEIAADSPDELSLLGLLVSGPDGAPAVAVAACASVVTSETEQAIGRLRALRPAADMIERRSWVDMQRLLDASFPAGMRHYWKSSYLLRVGTDAAEVLIESALRKPSASTGIGLQQMHGAAARVGAGETAFAHRSDQFDCIILSSWSDERDDAKNVGWTRELFAALEPYLETGVYVNNLGVEGDDRVRAAYGDNYDRLAALKATHDPENVFSLNQNIRPRVAGAPG